MPKVPGPPDKRRSDTMRIRLTEAERAMLDAAARPQPVSTWARDVLMTEARKKK